MSDSESDESWELTEDSIIDGEKLNLDSFCTISEEYRQTVTKFNTTGIGYTANFKNLEKVDDIEELLSAIFKKLLEESDVQSDEWIGFQIRHMALDTPILIPFLSRENISEEHIVRTIAAVIQSNQHLKLEEGLECQITKIKKPKGSGYKRIQNNGSIEEFLEKNRSVINVKGDDNLCLPRALVLSIGYAENDPKLPKLRNSDKYNLQKIRAYELMDRAKLSEFKGEWSISEVERFQESMSPEYQIKIFDKNDCSSIVFDGPYAPKQLNLLLHDNHFMVISKIQAFLNSSYWCAMCNKCYHTKTKHRKCPMKCKSCLQPGICPLTQRRLCRDCNRWFVSTECFNKHKQQATEVDAKKKRVMSICDLLWRCKKCGKEYDHKEKHECSEVYCTYCRKNIDKDLPHQCFMQIHQPKPNHKASFIFFDFETSQNEVFDDDNKYGTTFKHRVIWIVAHKVCDGCWRNNDMIWSCPRCHQRLHKFTGVNCLDSFVTWVFSSANHGSIAIAHNGKSFDFQFILKRLNDISVGKPEIMGRGTEILRLKCSGVTLIDSINFLPWSLATFPKAFQLTEMKKGYFPHLFSSLSNMDYVGPYPDAYFYSPAYMKSEKRESFYQWYNTKSSDTFNFSQEIGSYCNSDVDILKRGVMIFREEFIKQNDLDPLSNAVTISDACNQVFRASHLEENTIALLPVGDYRLEQKHSIIAMKWLKWIAHERNISIEHARNGKEFTISTSDNRKLRVDGRYQKEIFEFNGCHVHGCTKCFKPDQFLPIVGMKAREAHQRTQDRTESIKKLGYSVQEVWECDMKRMLKSNLKMATFFQNIVVQEPMQARDCYYGGRTNVFKLYHNVNKEQKINYIDICSLYPYILKYGTFPVGHPEIITENFKDLKHKPYEGLIKCRVVPPRRLYHPVLPCKIRNKLIFPLCKKCADEQQNSKCHHTDMERGFYGEWCTVELYKALEMGYKVTQIAEVWHYEKTSNVLFESYVNAYLKLKQEASGWPKWCITTEDKAKYLKDYEKHEDIKLDAEKIAPNPARRSLSKVHLNSLYGKFGQRPNKPQITYVYNPAEFYSLVCDPTNLIKSIQMLNNTKAIISYTKTDGFEQVQRNTNVVIAAYVTAQARLKLYSYLEKLQDKVLYCDTDSIIYLRENEDDIKIETGDYLGDMTDELDKYGPGAFISEWCSCGPKNYGFRVVDSAAVNHDVIKIRGFTLDSVTGKRLNLKTLKRKVFAFVQNGCREKVTVIRHKIERTPDRIVVTKPVKKTYSIVVDKRYCLKNYYSLPFGF